MRPEGPRFNSPDRQVWVTFATRNNQARRVDMYEVHAGPSDLYNNFNTMTTT